MRKIVVQGDTFLWIQDGSEFRAYLDGCKGSPLRLRFPERDGWQVGYPDAGVIWSNNHDRRYNLNRPGIAAQLIAMYYGIVWKPNEQRGPTVIEDALGNLEKIKPDG